MKLINTDGMALIGPGSEWFWTALTGVVLAITFLGIYRQLSMARSAGAREQVTSFEREWGSERMIRHKLAILVALRDGAGPADFGDAEASAWAVGNWWEGIGNLARLGHLDPKLLWDGGTAGESMMWWVILRPDAERRRAGGGGPTYWHNFEWLSGVMAEFERRAGGVLFDEAEIAGNLGRRISINLNLLRVEEALRTVIVASPDAMTAAQPPAPAAAES